LFLLVAAAATIIQPDFAHLLLLAGMVAALVLALQVAAAARVIFGEVSRSQMLY
jgi:hypothetical protein